MNSQRIKKPKTKRNSPPGTRPPPADLGNLSGYANLMGTCSEADPDDPLDEDERAFESLSTRSSLARALARAPTRLFCARAL